MGESKRLLLVAACLFVAATSAGIALGGTVSEPIEQLTLNSYDAAHSSVVSTRSSFESGKWYVATVRGTVSYYSATSYQPRPHFTVCGEPEPSPEIVLDGKTGPVGADAEVVFARVVHGPQCRAKSLPSHWNNFMVSTGATGSSFHHPDPFGGPFHTPAAGHTYRYPFRGAGRVVSFRLTDYRPSDNYGALAISIAAATTSDCSDDGWKYFDGAFSTQNACVSALAGS